MVSQRPKVQLVPLAGNIYSISDDRADSEIGFSVIDCFYTFLSLVLKVSK